MIKSKFNELKKRVTLNQMLVTYLLFVILSFIINFFSVIFSMFILSLSWIFFGLVFSQLEIKSDTKLQDWVNLQGDRWIDVGKSFFLVVLLNSLMVNLIEMILEITRANLFQKQQVKDQIFFFAIIASIIWVIDIYLIYKLIKFHRIKFGNHILEGKNYNKKIPTSLSFTKWIGLLIFSFLLLINIFITGGVVFAYSINESFLFIPFIFGLIFYYGNYTFLVQLPNIVFLIIGFFILLQFNEGLLITKYLNEDLETEEEYSQTD